MAKHVYHTCDRCNKKLPEDYKILSVVVDRQSDPAGSMEDVVEYLDLCQNCLVRLIDYFLDNKGYEERQEFVKLVRKEAIKWTTWKPGES